MGDDLEAARARRQHNQMMVDRVKGVPAQLATPESDVDPHNPNATTSSTPSAQELADWCEERSRYDSYSDELCLLLGRSAKALRRLSETERERDEKAQVAWLIERADIKPEAILYFCWEVFEQHGVKIRHWGWTADHLRAARFSRREDAALAWQAVTERELNEVEIHEHAWV